VQNTDKIGNQWTMAGKALYEGSIKFFEASEAEITPASVGEEASTPWDFCPPVQEPHEVAVVEEKLEQAQSTGFPGFDAGKSSLRSRG